MEVCSGERRKVRTKRKKHANEDETDITGKPQVEVAVK